MRARYQPCVAPYVSGCTKGADARCDRFTPCPQCLGSRTDELFPNEPCDLCLATGLDLDAAYGDAQLRMVRVLQGDLAGPNKMEVAP
jgi:hypothetical protein